MNLILSLLLCSLLSFHGLRKKSLSISGALAAFITGLLTFTHPHPLFAVSLLTFYLSSSALTRVGASIKSRLEEGHKVGGERSAVQVFSNGFTGTLFCCIHHFYSTSSSNNSVACTSMWGSDKHSLILRILLAAFLG
jgi:uncharacterized membrane protein